LFALRIEIQFKIRDSNNVKNGTPTARGPPAQSTWTFSQAACVMKNSEFRIPNSDLLPCRT
jgi:hypothetical protein